MNEALLLGTVIELAKMGLTVWMQASAMAGLTEAQKDTIYKEVKAEFDRRDPCQLPEV
jgi:hypothetical protein